MARDSTSHFLDTQRIYIPTSLTKKYGVLGDFQKKLKKILNHKKKNKTQIRKSTIESSQKMPCHERHRVPRDMSVFSSSRKILQQSSSLS